MAKALQAQGTGAGRTWADAQAMAAVSYIGADGRGRWSAEVLVEVPGLGWVREGSYVGWTKAEAEGLALARVATLLRGLCG